MKRRNSKPSKDTRQQAQAYAEGKRAPAQANNPYPAGAAQNAAWNQGYYITKIKSIL